MIGLSGCCHNIRISIEYDNHQQECKRHNTRGIKWNLYAWNCSLIYKIARHFEIIAEIVSRACTKYLYLFHNFQWSPSCLPLSNLRNKNWCEFNDWKNLVGMTRVATLFLGSACTQRYAFTLSKAIPRRSILLYNYFVQYY